MRIGFDAKRAFQNGTGLGHYSRTLIDSLVQKYPQHEYFLFAPKITDRFKFAHYPQMQTIQPETFSDKLLPSVWRSNTMTKDIQKNNIELFHGLSHEIPVGIQHTGTRSVVTIHDLIFERYPHQYALADRIIYRKKFTYACRYADRVIAISEQTKKDLIELYAVPEHKIDVCYQSCNPMYNTIATEEEKQKIRKLYSLPEKYFLSVGSIIERKNLLSICKALLINKNKMQIPLLVIGDGGKYKKKLMEFIRENGLENLVLFLSDTAAARQNPGFTNSTHFPAIYQMAEALIYPSEYEGFGIPVLEAMCSGLPVITSHVSCLPEVGGDAALYTDPYDAAQIAAHMKAVTEQIPVREACIEKGKRQAQKFTPEICAEKVMEVYLKIMA